MHGYLNDKCRSFWARLKKAHKSVSIWFNSIAGSFIIALPYLQEQLPQLMPYMSESDFRLMMGVIVAANIVLRFNTTKCLSQK